MATQLSKTLKLERSPGITYLVTRTETTEDVQYQVNTFLDSDLAKVLSFLQDSKPGDTLEVY